MDNFDEILQSIRVRNSDSPFVALDDNGRLAGFFLKLSAIAKSKFYEVKFYGQENDD